MVLTEGFMMAFQRQMYGKELDIDWNWLLVSKIEHWTHMFNVIFPKGTYQ